MISPARALAVVTGAGRGIGRAIALAFAKRGLDVALLGRHDDELARVAAELESLSARALPIRCDVADAREVEAAASRVLSAHGAPRFVVNNAGVVHRATIEETSDEAWNQVLAVNLRGPFLVTRAFLPAMRARRDGRIVQIASISATLGTPRLSAYCASKWGLLGLHAALTEELRGSGLQAIAVLPGSVDTEMLRSSGFAPQMTPDDVARAVVDACLDAPAAIHGASIELFGA